MKPHKDPSLLDNASQLLFHFNRMPRILQRMECHEIAFSWANQVRYCRFEFDFCLCTRFSGVDISNGELHTHVSILSSLFICLAGQRGGFPAGRD